MIESLELRRLLAAPLPTAEQQVSFSVGAIAADPQRNLVYLLDRTNDRVLAIDTDQGRAVAVAQLDDTPGELAVAYDRNRLFVTQPESKQIEILQLPGLTPISTLHTMGVGEFVQAGNGRLYASQRSSASGFGSGMYELDAETGAVLQTLIPTTTDPRFGVSADGNRVFAMTRLSGQSVYEYNASGLSATLNKQRALASGNSPRDFVIDDARQQLYIANSIRGVLVMDLANDATKSWSLSLQTTVAGSVALSSASGGSLFGASENLVNATIRQFAIHDGSTLADYTPTGRVIKRSMVATPNGNVVYVCLNMGNGLGEGYRVGIIGRSSIHVEDHAPKADFEVTPYSSRHFRATCGISVTARRPVDQWSITRLLQAAALLFS
jgi:DNA-binding beta-propeller fold protein YncE